jgi:hypothetical protein
VRTIPVFLTVLLLGGPALATGQSFELHGAAGAIVTDPGYNLTAGLGFSPTARLTFTFDFERTHLPMQYETYPEGVSAYTRGGTVSLGAAAMRISLFERGRVSPYGLVGLAAGRSRPNVNDVFPTVVEHDVVAPFFGGGVDIPLRPNLSLFADARLMLVAGTDSDELFALAPIRTGLAWRF